MAVPQPELGLTQRRTAYKSIKTPKNDPPKIDYAKKEKSIGLTQKNALANVFPTPHLPIFGPFLAPPKAKNLLPSSCSRVAVKQNSSMGKGVRGWKKDAPSGWGPLRLTQRPGPCASNPSRPKSATAYGNDASSPGRGDLLGMKAPSSLRRSAWIFWTSAAATQDGGKGNRWLAGRKKVSHDCPSIMMWEASRKKPNFPRMGLVGGNG